MISECAPEVGRREGFGDCEVDRVLAMPSSEVLATMEERRSHFTFVTKPSDKSSAIVSALHPQRGSVHDLTYYNGKEFAKHA